MRDSWLHMQPQLDGGVSSTLAAVELSFLLCCAGVFKAAACHQPPAIP
jgi:hypothetical protein